MAYLIALAGLAGAGKTTAVEFLSEMSGGEAVYLGAGVLETVRGRRLPDTRESERIVRLELREQKGPAALADLEAERIVEILKKGVPVLVDAIFVQAEFDLLSHHAQAFPTYLLAVTASFSTRCERLATRSERRYNHAELEARDRTEMNVLGTGAVLSGASYTIRNDGSMTAFHENLIDFMQSLSNRPGRDE